MRYSGFLTRLRPHWLIAGSLALVSCVIQAQDYQYLVHKPTKYKMHSCSSTDGASVITAENSSRSECSHWEVVNTGNYFFLKNRVSNKHIRPDTSNNGSAIVIQPNTWTGNWTQWSHIPKGDGYGHLKNRATGKFIFVAANSLGSPVEQQPSSWQGDYTRWKFEPVSGVVVTPMATSTPIPTTTATPTVTPTSTPTVTTTPAITPTVTATPTTTPTSDPTQTPVPNGQFTVQTDPSCTDGQYSETLPDQSANIGPIVSSIDSMEDPGAQVIADHLMQVLDLAYPYGAFIVRESPDFDRSFNCAFNWSNKGYGWETSWGLAIHECGHALDGFSKYYMSTNYELNQPANDYFWRQELTGDPYHNTIPDASANSTYFDVGSVTGDQGIQTMYDEWAQYVHSVALDYLLYPTPESNTTYQIEYMLNFAWAAPRYFLWAKNNHPDDFNSMMNSFDVREATLAIWGQTWLYYDAFANNTTWTPTRNETRYIDAINHPDLQAMMNEIRVKHGCEGI